MSKPSKKLFIASTRQHVGKTTTCLGLLSGFKKKIEHVSYMKPIGQEHVLVKKGLLVDKDVLLFKNHFQLKSHLKDMSPVLIPQGFTRDFLDQKVTVQELIHKIEKAQSALNQDNGFILFEGTGHCGVGSIVDLNNAQVAKILKSPVLLIASGGLGSSFDELMLNKTLCDFHGVKVIGVILNRVLPEKKEMVVHYMTQALKRWDIPLIGCIPFDPLLNNPTMKDFETLFETKLMTGEKHLFFHFTNIRLIATSVENYRDTILPGQLLITPANREDIILATLTKRWEEPHALYKTGMILTGDYPPRHYIVEELKKADIPMLYTPQHSHGVMQLIHSFTAKIQGEDVEKVNEAIRLVENQIDFPLLNSLIDAYQF